MPLAALPGNAVDLRLKKIALPVAGFKKPGQMECVGCDYERRPWTHVKFSPIES